MIASKKYINELIGLDLLRFILAVVIVLVHYYHFYLPFPDSPYKGENPLVPEQPLYSLLWPFYRFGGIAVLVFWLISGVIFFSVYEKEISNREIGFKKFAFYRFTRLYPLHFVTLLTILVAQLVFFAIHGSYFVYQTFDVSHFVLQLFLVAHWIPSAEHSFNVPMWSVSIEIFVYIIFYILAALSFLKGRRLPALIFVSLLFVQFGILEPFESCLLYFLSGCLVARLIAERVPTKKIFFWYLMATVASFVLVEFFQLGFTNEELGLYFKGLMELRIVLPASLLVLLFIVAFRNIASRKLTSLFKRMGNMTYSLYAIHLTVQIVMFMVINPTNYTIFNNPVYLFIFAGVSIVAGWMSFEYLEKPAQKYLRKKFEKKISGDEYAMEPAIGHPERPPAAG